jgi:FlaA1/EpsC-like NDP-sugar epimerase
MTVFHRISGLGLIAFGNDIVMAGLSFLIAIYLRVGATDYHIDTGTLIEGALILAAIAAIVLWVSGLYRGVWRYASIDDLVAITRAVSITILMFLVVIFAWSRMDMVPRSVPFINWFVLMAMLGGPRFLYRFWKDRRLNLVTSGVGGNRVPVLLIGASDGADQFLRGRRQSGDAIYHVVGILSDQPDRVGRTIRGVDVIGVVSDLESVIERLRRDGIKPQRLILTKDEIKGAPVRDLLDRAAALGMTLARVPKLTDFHAADGNGVTVKPVAIEDLLGRPQTPLALGALKALIGRRRVVITGAGGSIGSELVRQIAALGPQSVCLIENSEFALYTIDREIAEDYPSLERHAVIADVRDRARIDQVFAEHKPELVFHAAALKHVPLVEDNPAEGVRTNVAGTMNVADACGQSGVLAMVLISTDKAINPTSVMGATKRAAEMYCQSLDLQSGDGCRYVTVRFGNVLGSTGSVVPLFQRQLAKGGPLTVTHPDMTRYFMTIREAVKLVLQASATGVTEKATDGRIFVLDMGEPVKIVDLARQMIRLADLEPDKDIEITFTGIRPGEKLFEEIFHGGEPTVETEHQGLLLATPRFVVHDALLEVMAPLLDAAKAGDNAAVRDRLHSIIPEFAQQLDTPQKRAQSS